MACQRFLLRLRLWCFEARRIKCIPFSAMFFQWSVVLVPNKGHFRWDPWQNQLLFEIWHRCGLNDLCCHPPKPIDMIYYTRCTLISHDASWWKRSIARFQVRRTQMKGLQESLQRLATHNMWGEPDSWTLGPRFRWVLLGNGSVDKGWDI